MARRPSIRFALLAAALAGTAAGAASAPDVLPAAPPAETDADPGAAPLGFRAATALYSHGEPTDEEQVLLELMNRARLDPAAEAVRVANDYGDAQITATVNFFVQQRPGVEFTRIENRDAFLSYPAKPPFAFNAKLSTAARKHSELMIVHDEQSHQLPGEAGLRPRIEAEGYSGFILGESVYAFARSMIAAHAGFAIDWGQGVPNGQSRPLLGHRLSLMDWDGSRPYVEVGISVLAETKASTDVGPRVVTIDFGDPADTNTRFVTGVCYEDRNGSGFYDAGEGLAGVRIESPASTSYTISSASGGYALPVPKNAGAITVTATGEVGGPSEAVGVQNVPVVMAGHNVKLDFNTPPDPAIPAFSTFTSAGATALADASTTTAQISVPAFDVASPDVGDVFVGVDLAHPDASQLTMTLEAPSGAQVVLWDAGLPLADLDGTFGRTLAPVGDLGALVGTAYAGTWRLHVADAATGGSRSLDSWTVSIRPRWVRTLHAPRTNLALTTFKAKDTAAAAGDSLQLAGFADAAGRELDAAAPVHLRLLRPDGTEIQRYDVTAAVAARTATAKVVHRVKKTSKSQFTLNLRKLELPEALPSPVTVELSLGGALFRETVPLVKSAFNGKSARPAAPWFRVDAMTSRVPPKGGDRTTTIKGRLSASALAVEGLVEVFVGDAQGKLSAEAFKRTGTKATATSKSGLLRQVVIDARTGAFTIVLVGAHDPRSEGDRAPIALRVGTSFYGATEIAPAVVGLNGTY